jgi:hypothetical protein
MKEYEKTMKILKTMSVILNLFPPQTSVRIAALQIFAAPLIWLKLI